MKRHALRGASIVLPDGTQVVPELRVPGSFNVSNAACALAAAVELGVGVPEALRGMRTVTSPAGRFATATLHGTSVRLLLAKNPAGWAEALSLVAEKIHAAPPSRIMGKNHPDLTRRHPCAPSSWPLLPA